MRHLTTKWFTGAVVALSLAGLTAALAADGEESGRLKGEVLIGFRLVDTDGRIEKYRQNINLDSGARLFDLSLDYQPAESGLGSAFDQIQLEIGNFGGDPFESAGLTIRKFDAYEFRYLRTESIYFYDDIILPAGIDLDGDGTFDSSPSYNNAGDFATRDIKRIRDSASLDLNLTDRDVLSFGFDRFTRRGTRKVSYTVSRDEFQLDSPVDESLNDYRLSYSHTWPRATLILEEQVRDYDNMFEAFLPGFSLGEDDDPSDLTTLSSYFIGQPYDLMSHSHGVRVNAQPTDWFIIRAAGRVENLELDGVYEEEGSGVAFFGLPFNVFNEGVGEIERDLTFIDVDVSFLLSDRWALVGGVRQREQEQYGNFLIDGDTNLGQWDISTFGASIGAQVQASDDVVVSGGVGIEERDVDFGVAAQGDSLSLETEPDTERTTAYADIGWSPGRFKLNLSYENGSFDHPFTLTSPTDTDRIRFRGRYSGESGAWVGLTFQTSDAENSNSGWDSSYDTTRLEVGYNGRKGQVSASYAAVDVDRMISPVINGFFPYMARYQLDNATFSAQGRIRLGKNWQFGARYLTYEAGETPRPTEWFDSSLFIEHEFDSGILARGSFRQVDYKETLFGFNNYKANIGEFSTGYRW